MDFKVLLSPEALSDLERIIAYIASHNPAAAEATGNRLLDTALSLDTLAERGRLVPELQPTELREIIFRSYRIIYRINHADRIVEIVRFWHAARGFPHVPRTGLGDGTNE